jgi:hypothetical protein
MLPKRNHLYLGKAGQFAVMSELLCRGWNVAVPEVDIGDDIFVVRDANGEFIRVQVKTSTTTERRESFSVQFSLSIEQLEREVTPELVYVFAVRHKDKGWAGHIVISREILFKIYQNTQSSLESGNITLYFSFKSSQNIMCWDYNFAPFWNNFEIFPVIHH